MEVSSFPPPVLVVDLTPDLASLLLSYLGYRVNCTYSIRSFSGVFERDGKLPNSSPESMTMMLMVSAYLLIPASSEAVGASCSLDVPSPTTASDIDIGHMLAGPTLGALTNQVQ